MIEIYLILLFTLHNTKNIAYHIMDVLIFYADKLTVMGNSKNSRVFNFVILLKSWKLDARKIYMFYSMPNLWKKVFGQEHLIKTAFNEVFETLLSTIL